MKKIVLRIISAICMVLLCFSTASCSNPEGLNMGFKGKWIGTLPDVHFGIQSDKTEFDISNVTLDFSYGDGRIGEVGGYIGNYVEGADEIEDCPIVCVAVYFYNSRYGDTLGEARFEDYKNIEGLYFVKEISLDDYNENYDVENNIFGSKYEHTETLTIPQETFELTTGFVCIGVYAIAYIPSQNLYRIADGADKGLKYEILDDGKVKISEPGQTVYDDPK